MVVKRGLVVKVFLCFGWINDGSSKRIGYVPGSDCRAGWEDGVLLGGCSTFLGRSSVLTTGDCEGVEISNIRLNKLRSGPLVVGFVNFSFGTVCD